MTDAEWKMWRGLRESFRDAHFRRQAPIRRYFTDFISHRCRLVVELDGGQHAETVDYDARRTIFLNDQGYRVLRFWNNEVMQNPDGVLAVIASHLSPSPSHAAVQRGPRPLSEGEGRIRGEGIEARRSRAPA